MKNIKIQLKVLDKDLYYQSIKGKGWDKPPEVLISNLPKYSTKESAGVDLRVREDKVINPIATVLIGTGIAIHINNPNVMGLITPRSGLGHREGIILGNTVGVTDSDYQGEILLSVWNRNPNKAVYLCRGDRIAQMVFVPVIRATFDVVEDFSNVSDRGSKGYGSSGVK